MSERYRIVLKSKGGQASQYWTMNYGFFDKEYALTFSESQARCVLRDLINRFPSIYEDPQMEPVPVRSGCPAWLQVVVVGLLVAILFAVILKP